MAIGDTSSGFINAVYHIGKLFEAGIHLQILLKRTEYYLEIARIHNITRHNFIFCMFRDTVLFLMGRECNTDFEVDTHPIAAYHKAVRAFWLGHSERSHHFCSEIFDGILPEYRNHRMKVMLFYGLNSLKIRQRLSRIKIKEVRSIALEMLNNAAKSSEYNFKNKVHLLEAQIFSREKKNEEAQASFIAAIASARSSGFIHEQGLASELAGLHYKQIGDVGSASRMFHQAKQCYDKWGSQLKVDSITRQLELLQI